MLVEQVDSLFSYWRSSPPVHELVAAYMGMKPEQAGEQDQVGVSEDEKAFVERMRARMDDRG